ncbi:MAG: hypothetical protein JOZ96_14315 [Acidobacteria bacterium]|nr:hypothetical protein [Acidobacteriota bacterium]
MRRLLTNILLLTLVCARPCSAQNQDYLPLTKAETDRRFPVKLVGRTGGGDRPGYFGLRGEGPAASASMKAGPSGSTFEMDEEGRAVVTGKDKGGAAWRVRLGNLSGYGARLYTADLDRDGVQDLVIVAPTGGNGLAPTTHLTALTFDGRGRPVLFEADGYFQEDARGVFDLLDLDRDGRAELLYMNFDDGYWVTTLYEVEGGHWRHVVGAHGRRTYPLYTRFTNRPNRRPVAPKPGRKPFTPDLSNDAPALRGTLASYEWADVSQSEDIKLVIDENGRRVTCSPVSWFGSFGVVSDSDEGREVVTVYGNEEAAQELLKAAVQAKSAVTLYGRRSAERCSPEWLWLSR